MDDLCAVIRAFMAERGYPPSIREIAVALGLSSTASVAALVARAERKGRIRREPNQPRTLRIVEKG